MKSTWPQSTFVLASLVALSTSASLSFTSCLHNIPGSNSSTLVFPDSPSYPSARREFNYIFDYLPAAVYFPDNTNNVAAAVKCAATYNVSVAPRSGGHSYEGYSAGGKNGTLIIDLNKFHNFAVNSSSSTAKYGAGFRLGQLYTKLWDNGKYLIPAGTCPTVGVGGHGLGGGIGLVARKWGMLSDNLIGMTVVDAQGRILKVSKSENPDLFWALRGAGGGSFGVVVDFEARIYQPPSLLTTIQVQFPLSRYSQVIDGYGRWGRTADENITTEMNLGTDGISLQATYLGPTDGAKRAIAGLFQLTGDPDDISYSEANWIQGATNAAYINNGTIADPVIGDARYARGRSLVYRSPMSATERDIIFRYLRHPAAEASSSYIIIDIWGGKIDRPELASAFDNHRGVLYSIEFVAEWGDSTSPPGLAACTTCLRWSRDFIRDMRAAYSGPLEAYQNYIERDLPGALDAYYGKSLPRLKSIKRQVDPLNVFSFPQSIPLS